MKDNPSFEEEIVLIKQHQTQSRTQSPRAFWSVTKKPEDSGYEIASNRVEKALVANAVVFPGS